MSSLGGMRTLASRQFLSLDCEAFEGQEVLGFAR
jgi:hypothetical protein